MRKSIYGIILEHTENKDRELSYYINELFRSLLHEILITGGLFELSYYDQYLDDYIDFLDESEFEDIKFIGFQNLKIFLDGDKNKMIKSQKEKFIEIGRIDIVDEIEAKWSELNTVENFEDVIISTTDYAKEFIEYAFNNEVNRMIMIYFESLYKNEELEIDIKNSLEELLIKKGGKKVWNKINGGK